MLPLALFCFLLLSACTNGNTATSQDSIAAIANKVWAFGNSHPNGFTLNIRTMSEPEEGIAVSYAATQNSHTRDQLKAVVSHALQHDGYVGGWRNQSDGQYYFDSTRLFPETSLSEAIQFGKENGQRSAYILSTSTDIPVDGKVAEIVERRTMLVGTTGDYRPLSFCEPDGTYWGFGIEIAQEIAQRMNVSLEFVKTSWPTLSADGHRQTRGTRDGKSWRSEREVRKRKPPQRQHHRTSQKRRNTHAHRHRRSRRDDNGSDGGSILRKNRHATCRPAPQRALYTRRDWCTYATGTGRPSADGERRHQTDEKRWHPTPPTRKVRTCVCVLGVVAVM